MSKSTRQHAGRKLKGRKASGPAMPAGHRVNGQNHRCPTCGEHFPTSFSLGRHIKRAHGNKRWRCFGCQGLFKRREYIRSHQDRQNSICKGAGCEEMDMMEFAEATTIVTARPIKQARNRPAHQALDSQAQRATRHPIHQATKRPTHRAIGQPNHTFISRQQNRMPLRAGSVTETNMAEADRDHMKTELVEAIATLCRNCLQYDEELRIEGLIGITLDERDVFLINVKEEFRVPPESSKKRKRPRNTVTPDGKSQSVRNKPDSIHASQLRTDESESNLSVPGEGDSVDHSVKKKKVISDTEGDCIHSIKTEQGDESTNLLPEVISEHLFDLNTSGTSQSMENDLRTCHHAGISSEQQVTLFPIEVKPEVSSVFSTSSTSPMPLTHHRNQAVNKVQGKLLGMQSLELDGGEGDSLGHSVKKKKVNSDIKDCSVALVIDPDLSIKVEQIDGSRHLRPEVTSRQTSDSNISGISQSMENDLRTSHPASVSLEQLDALFPIEVKQEVSSDTEFSAPSSSHMPLTQDENQAVGTVQGRSLSMQSLDPDGGANNLPFTTMPDFSGGGTDWGSSGYYQGNASTSHKGSFP